MYKTTPEVFISNGERIETPKIFFTRELFKKVMFIHTVECSIVLKNEEYTYTEDSEIAE